MQEVFYSFLSSDYQPLNFITHDFPLQQYKEPEGCCCFFENLGFKTAVAKDCWGKTNLKLGAPIAFQGVPEISGVPKKVRLKSQTSFNGCYQIVILKLRSDEWFLLPNCPALLSYSLFELCPWNDILKPDLVLSSEQFVSHQREQVEKFH